MSSRPLIAAISILTLYPLLISAGCEQQNAAPAAREPDEATKTATTTGNDVKEEKMQSNADRQLQTATFGAGCFWGVESVFRQIDGVKDAAVGYCGGKLKNPTYRDVCGDQTGHAEAVQIQYDPQIVSYDKLLSIFWKCHDPTQVNRQGPDVGTQYRSVIFYHTPEQKAAAEASKQALEQSGKYRRPIATEIVPAATFYRAEEYHQQYLAKHGLPSCHVPDDK